MDLPRNADTRKSSGSNPKRDEEEALGIQLGFYIHDTSRLRRAIFDAAFKAAGVTRTQGWGLAILGRQDNLAQAERAALLEIGKVAVGGLIARLEALNFVERRPDAKDRPIKRVSLTPAGGKVLTKMRKVSVDPNVDILAGIDIEDIRVTARTLKAVKESLLKRQKGEPVSKQ